jgi:hypothetical protein
VPALSSERTTKDGASMDARGCNRWQPVANQASRKTAQIGRNGCHRLPESFHGKEGSTVRLVRGLRRFEPLGMARLGPFRPPRCCQNRHQEDVRMRVQARLRRAPFTSVRCSRDSRVLQHVTAFRQRVAACSPGLLIPRPKVSSPTGPRYRSRSVDAREPESQGRGSRFRP